MGYVTWMDAEKAKRKWKDAKEVVEATITKGTSSSFDTFEDKPAFATWYDSKRKRILIPVFMGNNVIIHPLEN